MTDLPKFRPSNAKTIPDCYLRMPKTDTIKGVLIAVHGISRNAAEIALRFSQSPDFNDWAIVAPVFEKARFGQYQQLIANRRKTASDDGLLMLLEQLAQDYDLPVAQISLFGFSGGAQMVHRFTMLHPTRVSKVVAVAAGWYMLPDADLPYPIGWSDVGLGRNSDISLALTVPIAVLVGSDDKQRDAALRRSPIIDQRMGTNRYLRAKRWCREMRKAARNLGIKPKIEFDIVPDCTHDFGMCVEHGDLISLTAKYIN